MRGDIPQNESKKSAQDPDTLRLDPWLKYVNSLYTTSWLTMSIQVTQKTCSQTSFRGLWQRFVASVVSSQFPYCLRLIRVKSSNRLQFGQSWQNRKSCPRLQLIGVFRDGPAWCPAQHWSRWRKAQNWADCKEIGVLLMSFHICAHKHRQNAKNWLLYWYNVTFWCFSSSFMLTIAEIKSEFGQKRIGVPKMSVTHNWQLTMTRFGQKKRVWWSR